MTKFIIILFSFILISASMNGCRKKHEPDMIDIDNVETDGSYDDKYIFRKQIEKEKIRGKKYKKDKF